MPSSNAHAVQCDNAWHCRSKRGGVGTAMGAKAENAVCSSSAHECERREGKRQVGRHSTNTHHQTMANGHVGWMKERRMPRTELVVVRGLVIGGGVKLGVGVWCISTTSHHQTIAR